ncbi:MULTISPECIES: DUF6344 domain-containing protein [unclassified Streptomyces]|uniref:DUF6344 domain-containing protein n=1 Tax=unclassified Streptomyces TaxID=2593676 RepID=UPI000DAE9667|nr:MULTISPECIES: DUF6344 domain-containing protein [unclassified Streptomyces]PZT72854.1 hypothetical protein DNK55_30780 [Streptomyces sp. AC1-42T]PZT80827.1 hypothetical protein DNK56_00790 [Streptomyces sp. AC1-42W]
MSTVTAKSIWTAFITAFFALLASLGLAGSTAAAAESTHTNTERAATTPVHTPAARATATGPSVRWTLPRDRALPPTMKQRIRAEAHGSSPATRHLSVDAANAVNTTGTARSSHGAPEQDASLLPP